MCYLYAPTPIHLRTMSLASRRRSSAFRPHNGLYPPFPRAKRLSLEQLPLAILSLILDLLQTPHLLAVCLASKDLYLPAAAQLYRKLVVSNDALAFAYARAHLRLYGRNYGTAVHPEALLSLGTHLERNRKLAVLVRAVYVGPGAHPEAVARLLACTAPSDVYLDPHLAPLWAGGARRLTCAPALFARTAPRNLTQLRLAGAVSNPAAVARALASCPVRTLVFRSTRPRNLHQLNQQNAGEPPQPPWLEVFREVTAHGTRLELLELELDGHVADAPRAVQIVSAAVALDRLVALLLRTTERSHWGAHHAPESQVDAPARARLPLPPTSFLPLLTLATPAISRLCVYPTNDCLTCQEESVVAAVRTLAGQLETLTLREERTTLRECCGRPGSVRAAILAFQPRLTHLDCRGPASLTEARAHLYPHLDPAHISEWERGLFYEHRIRATFFANDFAAPAEPFVPDPLARCMTACAPAIARYLECDPVFAARPAHLQEYSVVDFCVAMPRRALVVNGLDVALAPA